MSVWLVMQATDGSERKFAIKSSTVIGRETTCDVRVPIPSVGLKHCQLVLDGQELKLIDLRTSDRGTLHNGNRVQEAVLANEDKVTIGPVTFTVRVLAEQNGNGHAPEVVIERQDAESPVHEHLETVARV